MTEPTPSRRYLLRPLVDCAVEEQLAIREIRNSDAVRRAMYTDHLITVNEHLAWIEGLKSDDRQVVWCVLRDGDTPVGVVSLNAIDRKNRKADWAFYLAPSERGGTGSALEYFVLNHVFGELGLEKLNCEVLETNPAVVSMHRKFGFVEEGLRRSNIVKPEGRVGVHLLGITDREWEAHRPRIEERYGERLAAIRIALDEPAGDEPSVIDQIQSARARNNINWMSLLRLSVQHGGDDAKRIIGEIMKIDREISDLTERLVELDGGLGAAGEGAPAPEAEGGP